MLSFSPPSTAYILDKFAKKLGLRLERVDIAHGCVPVTVTVWVGLMGRVDESDWGTDEKWVA